MQLLSLKYGTEDSIWLLRKFNQISRQTCWDGIANQRKFLDFIGQNIFHTKTWTDWYEVTLKRLCSHGAQNIVSKYQNLPKLFVSVFPEYNWMANFQQKQISEMLGDISLNDRHMVTLGEGSFYHSLKNQRIFLDWIAKKRLHINHLDEWCDLPFKVLSSAGVSTLLLHYDASPPKMLLSVYPEHNWLLWKFYKLPKDMWQQNEYQQFFTGGSITLKSQRLYLDWAGHTKFNIKNSC